MTFCLGKVKCHPFLSNYYLIPKEASRLPDSAFKFHSKLRLYMPCQDSLRTSSAHRRVTL